MKNMKNDATINLRVGLYVLPFIVCIFLVALRESERYGYIYDFLPVLGGTIPFFTLTVLLTIVYKFNGGSLREIGLCWPTKYQSITKTMLWILMWACIVMFLRVVSLVIFGPLLETLGEPSDLSKQSATLAGNLTLLLTLLPMMWLVVLGEELLFRGYIMNYIAHKFGQTTKAWVYAILISSILFGLLHIWKTPRGMLGTAINSVAFGIGYYLADRNLLPVVLAHAIGNTMGFVVFYID
jgi:hypothetical protein